MYYYITLPFSQVERKKTYTFEEIFDEVFDKKSSVSPQNTLTYKKQDLSLPAPRYIDRLIFALKQFNDSIAQNLHKPYEKYYSSFLIPKASGGFRKITAPSGDLKEAQKNLAGILQNDFKSLSHTSAYAYVKKRSAYSAVVKHRSNFSRWFLKLDFHDFFGSMTKEFVLKQLSMIYPYCFILKDEAGEVELKKALDICFYNGSLPQGSPISPLLTNIVMTPLDYEINKYCSTHSPYFVYTRYSDDIGISCKYNFEYRKVIQDLSNIFAMFDAPLKFNTKKTTYGSASGRNWILGVMYTKECKITYGHKKKERFKAAVFSFLKDYTNGKIWSVDEANTLRGMISYYNSIDAETTKTIIDKYNAKFNLSTLSLLSMIISGKIGG